jgi:hypothetical protein
MKNENHIFCNKMSDVFVGLRKTTYENMAKDIDKLFRDIDDYMKQENIRFMTDFAIHIDTLLPAQVIYCGVEINEKNGKNTGNCLSKYRQKVWNMPNEKYVILRVFLDSHLKPNQENVK